MQHVVQHIYMIPILASTILGLRSFRERWAPAYRLFSLLLCAVCFVELTAISWSLYLAHLHGWPWSDSNLWLYNLFLIPQYILYMAVYYLEIDSTHIKKAILACALVFTAFAVFNMGWLQGLHSVDSYTLTLASVIIIFMTVTWFNQLLHKKEIYKLSSVPLVWISAGAFIFHAADPPYLLSLNYLVAHNRPLAIALFYIFLILNCLMYAFYTIAFLCQPPPQK
jgi:hypothetical protein